MNTPTPRADEAARKGAYLTAGEYPETCGKQIVHIDFARELERELAAVTVERDNLRGCLNAGAQAVREAHHRIKAVEDYAGRADSQIVALRDALQQIYLGDIFDVTMREIAKEALAAFTAKYPIPLSPPSA